MTKLPLMVGLTAAALAASAPVAAAETCVGKPGPGLAKMTLEATTLHDAAGEVAFTVYPDEKSRFLAKGGKLVRARVPANQPRACFWLKPGYYAIAQYHDENADHNFNRTLFLPKEGFGFSNDAPTSVGLPSFASARVQLPAAGTTLRMTMRYRR